MNITVSQPFPFEIEGLGTIMDYVEDRFLFIVKDEFWSEEEKAMLMQEPMEVALYYRYDVAVFLVSGGDIDTSDFYFNVQECEWKEQLLSSTTLQASLILLDQDNIVCCRRDVTFRRQIHSRSSSCCGNKMRCIITKGNSTSTHRGS